MAKGTAKSQKTEPLIYVIAGKDSVLVNKQYEQLVDQLLEPAKRVTGLFVADTDKVSASQIFDELRTLPFLSDRRVVVIKQADEFISSNRQLLENYFDKPCQTGVLILTVSSFKSNTILARKINNFGKLIMLGEAKSWELPVKLKQYIQDAYSKSISSDAAELLVALTGEQLGRLYSQIDKIALYADKEKTINVHHVEQLVGKGRLYNVFNAIDFAISGDGGAAAGKLRDVFKQDKTSQFTFIGAFAYHLRRLFSARAMLENGITEQQIIKNLRLWYGKEAFLSQLHKVTLRQIGSLIGELAQADYEIKTGRISPETAAEQLAFKLAFN